MAQPGALRNINTDAFIQAWNARHISRDRIAAMLGVSPQAVSLKAKTLGLPSRKGSQQVNKKGSDDLFRRMWEANVATAEMARHFGYSHRSSVTTRARHMGLPKRQKGKSGKRNGGWAATITLVQFFEMEMARRIGGKG